MRLATFLLTTVFLACACACSPSSARAGQGDVTCTADPGGGPPNCTYPGKSPCTPSAGKLDNPFFPPELAEGESGCTFVRGWRFINVDFAMPFKHPRRCNYDSQYPHPVLNPPCWDDGLRPANIGSDIGGYTTEPSGGTYFFGSNYCKLRVYTDTWMAKSCHFNLANFDPFEITIQHFGQYTVPLPSDILGWMAWYTINVETPATPLAVIDTTQIDGTHYRFGSVNSVARNPLAKLISRRWTVNGGPVGSSEVIELEFSNPAVYKVRLEVTDDKAAVSDLAEVVIDPAAPPGIEVNSIGDSPATDPTVKGCSTGGPGVNGKPECTLRAALQALNAGYAAGVTFKIPGAGSHVIAPASALPTITRAAATIDGKTQLTGAVVIDGQGLVVDGADGVTIRGLTLVGGASYALSFVNAANGKILGNVIGVLPDGTPQLGVGGVTAVGAAGLQIGGAASGEGNVIGASKAAILIGNSTTETADGVQVRGNFIGVNADGTPLGDDGTFGVLAISSGPITAKNIVVDGNTIAGFEHNLVAGGESLAGLAVTANHVGTDPAGETGIGTPQHNIRLDGVPNATVASNTVSGAAFDILVAGSIQLSVSQDPQGGLTVTLSSPLLTPAANPITGHDLNISANLVGLASGATVAHSLGGIRVWDSGDRATIGTNRVSGHGTDELRITGGKGHHLVENRVGIDVETNRASLGISVEKADDVTLDGNVVGGTRAGITLSKTTHATLANNATGLAIDGATAKAVDDGIRISADSSAITIGPNNTIANAVTTGIAISGKKVAVVANKVGVPAFGSGTGRNAVGISVATAAEEVTIGTHAAPNVIAGNGIGVRTEGKTVTIDDNTFGVITAGPRGNDIGIVVGADAAIGHNTIANSGQFGVQVLGSGIKATLRSNAIFGTTSKVGIDGPPSAPTVVGAARVIQGTSTRTWLVLAGLPTSGAGVIEVFGNPTCDDPEGKVPLFTKTPNAGKSTRVLNVIGRPDLQGLTVTYTDHGGKTSRFSTCATPAPMSDGDGDGIPDIVEAAGPLPTESDAQVASVVTDADQWIALVAPVGAAVKDFRLLDDPDPDGHVGKIFPIGFFTFTVTGVPTGEVSTVSLILPLSINVTAWWKHGPKTAGAAPSFWGFVPDEATGTGATVAVTDFPGFGPSRLVELAIADGGRGDEDFLANGSLVDPGGPSICAGDDSPPAIECRLAALQTGLDSFRCYVVKPASGSPKFAPVAGVRANGTFDDVLVDLKKPVQLCAPAVTTGAGRVDPETHLEAYAVKLQKGQPKIVPQSGRQVTSQLGTMVVDTAKPAQLLVPTAEDPASSPSLTTNELDRFTCYPAKLAKGQPKLPKTLQLTVGDQFTDPPKRVTVKKLARLCTPVGVNGGAPKHTAHLLCFQVAATKGRCADVSPSNAGGGCKQEADCGGTKGQTTLCVAQAKFAKRAGRNVVNDLDAGTLDAAKEDVVCLPALLAP